MGKASRRKRQDRPDPAQRLAEGRCVPCGAKTATASLRCSACAEKGRRRPVARRSMSIVELERLEAELDAVLGL